MACPGGEGADVPGPFCLYKEHQGRSERTKGWMEAILSQDPPRASLKQLSPKRQQEELSIRVGDVG